MKLKEALTELTRYVDEPYSKFHPYFTEAVKLGIEALKERQEAIEQGLPLWHELLPGETKD